MPGHLNAFCLTLALMLLQTGAAGCHTCFPRTTLTFRAIDATTRQPLAEVQARRSSSDMNILSFPLFAGTEGNFPLPPSANDGIIVADKLCHDLSHSFTFRRTGYLEAHAIWGAGGRILLDLPPTDPHHDRQGQFSDTRAPIDVPMYPHDTPVVTYAPVWTPVLDVPPEVARQAERVGNGKHPPELTVWRDQPVTRRTFKNQYGDYGILWIVTNPKTGGLRWECVEITPRGSVSLHASGGTAPSSEPPTLESLDAQRP